MEINLSSPSKPAGNKRNTLVFFTLIPLLAAILTVSQVALSFIPNVEVVSLLIIVFTISLGFKVLPVIYIFAFAEMLIYGFQMWAWNYLYVWTILWLAVMLLRKFNFPFYVWAVISGIFGLMFGFLCSFLYMLVGGFYYGISWWISGLLFDLYHCAGNFAACIFLFEPLNRIFKYLCRRLFR